MKHHFSMHLGEDVFYDGPVPYISSFTGQAGDGYGTPWVEQDNEKLHENERRGPFYTSTSNMTGDGSTCLYGNARGGGNRRGLHPIPVDIDMDDYIIMRMNQIMAL